jgi:hypothetical protein
MSIEVTKERLGALGLYEGKITVESSNVYDNEIVVRIPFGDGKRAKELAESAYDNLLLL